MTDLYAATSKHLLLRHYPSAITTVHSLLDDLRSRHPFIYNRPERTNSKTPQLLVKWEAYPYSTIQALKLLCTVYVSAWAGGVTEQEVRRKGRSTVGAGSQRSQGRKQEGPRDLKLEALAKCLPPSTDSSNAILTTTLEICLQTLSDSQPPHTAVQTKSAGNTSSHSTAVLDLPPSLVLTFLLACIKISSSTDAASETSTAQPLRGNEDAISFARKLFEDWLAVFPDECLYALSQARPQRTPCKPRKSGVRVPLEASTSSLASSTSSVNTGNISDTSASASTVLVEALSSDDQDRSFLLQFKKDYLRLVEVYVLEILPRQDDWDIASDFIMGEFVMGAKRKEQMLKRLHDAKSKHTATMTRARRSTATCASAGNFTRSTSGAPNSMTSLSASSALDPEDLDTETIIAGGSVSRRSSAASTERTARPFDRGTRPVRGSANAQVADDSRRGANEQHPEQLDPGSTASPDATVSRTGKGPVTRAVSSFAALRSRIIEYLDEPLSEPRSSSAQTPAESSANGNEARRNRPRRQAQAGASKAWRVLSLLRPRYLATITIGLLFLIASRQWRRKNRKALAGPGQNTGSTIPLWYIMASQQWWRNIFDFAWQKLRMMISMGTTLTYV
ncbi:hypothetical protein QFC22_000439 [Naganishia vaughanmartiniae]|uniref:Uncharacterized protein n=1 Tax=Naganishia vaughanmartiniae TaxID=1424756 RepID=A0ACC2XPC5_9TREE|nr:hypothetical protein QFC22_000439 [Naganishia vaughanmartiniae]